MIPTVSSVVALGERIRRLRQKRGLTQRALADAAGVSLVYLRKLEAGERTSPSFPVLERLARALGAAVRLELIEHPKGGRP